MVTDKWGLILTANMDNMRFYCRISRKACLCEPFKLQLIKIVFDLIQPDYTAAAFGKTIFELFSPLHHLNINRRKSHLTA